MAWPTEQGQVGQDEEGQQIRCGPEHGTQEVWGPVKGGFQVKFDPATQYFTGMQTAIAPTLLPHTSVGTCPQHGHPNTKYPSSLTSSICINWNVLPCLLTHFPKGGNLMSMFILLGQAPEVLCFWSVSGRSLLGPVSKA